MSVEPPVVSFVIPTRNEAEYLPDTLDSIANQDASIPYEVIISDAESTDGTREIAREWGEEAGVPLEVVQVKFDEREGHGIARGRNRGAAEARGEWLAFIDADTVLEEGYLGKMYEFAESEGVDVASSHTRYRENSDWRVRFAERVVNSYFFTAIKPVSPGFNTFVNADAFERVGGFPNVPLEDCAFSQEITKTGEYRVLPEPMVTTSARRILDMGAIGTTVYYLKQLWSWECAN